MEKGNPLQDVRKINYLKLMKHEILIEIWLKLANNDHKETKNQKRAFEWYPKGANIHESQDNL